MEQVLYVTTLGIFLAVAIGLLLWVHYHLYLAREKSPWKRQQLGLQAGILTLIILALISYFAFYFLYRDHGAGHIFVLVGLFSSMIIAQCGIAVYSLSDRRLITWKDHLAHFAMPVLLLLGYYAIIANPTTREPYSTWLRIVAAVYYIGYVIFIYRTADANAKKFHQRLEDNYVEIDERQVMYRAHAVIFCVSILGAWGVFVLVPSYILHSCYFVLSTFGWTYFTYVVVRIEDSPLANAMQVTTPGDNENAPEEVPTDNDLLFSSPVMQRLNEEIDRVLVNDGLYLDPDLDISMVAKALCTNRTYIGRLLRMRGTSFSRYINSLRLTHAEELLRTSTKSVREICDECGFSDATFRRCFADRYNCTPMEYRRRVKGYF